MTMGMFYHFKKQSRLLIQQLKHLKLTMALATGCAFSNSANNPFNDCKILEHALYEISAWVEARSATRNINDVKWEKLSNISEIKEILAYSNSGVPIENLLVLIRVDSKLVCVLDEYSRHVECETWGTGDIFGICGL